jgi:hypothetical protein
LLLLIIVASPENMSVYHLIYRSTANPDLGKEQIKRLLVKARAHNQEQAITGILLHGAGQFMQVLEGPQEPIAELYARIEADERHHDVLLLTDGTSPSRIFPRWSMGYLAASRENFTRLVNYVDPRSRPSARPTRPGSIATGYLALLQEFALSQPVLY